MKPADLVLHKNRIGPVGFIEGAAGESHSWVQWYNEQGAEIGSAEMCANQDLVPTDCPACGQASCWCYVR